MAEQLPRGTIRVGSGTLRASDAEKYERVEFQGRRWAGVDPKKEEDANAIAFGMRTKSLSKIIREKAEDPDKVWAEIAEDDKKLAELGIEVSLPGAKAEAPPEDDTDGNNANDSQNSGNDG